MSMLPLHIEIFLKIKKGAFMLGAIIGDVAGSIYEFHPVKNKNLPLFVENKYFNKDGELTLGYFSAGSRFTDDTVMSVAVCKALLDCDGDYSNLRENVIKNMKAFGERYPYAGYGVKFSQWLRSSSAEPYNSFGNGSAMRVSPVAYFAKSLDEVKTLSRMVTDVTHNHPEGIKGAEAAAVCIWLALRGKNKEEIKKYVEENYYNLDFDYDDLVKNYKFDETCQGSVPQSIYSFLISNSFEDCLKTAISMGGDADTMATVAGGIAEAFYGLPKDLETQIFDYLTDDLAEVVERFCLYKKEKNNEKR